MPNALIPPFCPPAERSQYDATLLNQALGNRRLFVEQRPALLIRHLDEEQKRQLLSLC
jgi:hypothetical protein